MRIFIKAITVFFENYRIRNKLTDLFIINTEGTVVYSSAAHVDIATNLHDGPWSGSVLAHAYRVSLQAQDPSFIQLFDFSLYLPQGNSPTAFIATPVVDRQELVGVLIGAFGTTRLDAIVTNNYNWEAEGLGKTGEIYLIGSDLFMRSSSRLLTEQPAVYLRNLEAVQYNSQLIKAMEESGSSILLQRVATPPALSIYERKSGVERSVDYLGNEVISAYSPLSLPNLNWGLIVEIDVQEAYSPVEILKGDIIQSLALVLLVIAVLTLLVARTIMLPILELTKGVNRLSEGDYFHRIKDQSLDEIGELSRAFDQMADTINERSVELVQANKKLTDEIEEKAKTEKALQQERDFMGTILDSQLLLLIITDAAGNIVRVNKKLEAASGFTKDELDHASLEKLFPEGTDMVKKAAGKVFENNLPEDFIVNLATRVGTTRVIRLTVTNLLTTINPNHLIWMGVDITEHRQMEEQLKENEVMLQSLMNSAQDSFIISDEKDCVILWNEAAEKMFGYREKEIIGKPVIPTLIPPDYEGSFIRGVNRLFKDDENRMTNLGTTLDVEGKRKNGEKFPVEISMSLVKVKDHWNTLYIIRDATARHQRENELKAAYEKARIAEKTKTDFLANMSHEIRTPLNGILGFLELLQTTKMDTVQYDYLRIINNSADSLLGVINEILDFSKIESGKMHIENVDFNIYEEIEHAVEIYTAKSAENNIDLIVDLDTDIPFSLIGDPMRLRQILINLLSNAIKFTNAGGYIKISSRLLEKREKACVVRLVVEDSGIGISPEMQASIFEAFSQADTSVTRKYGGTGLGLSICAEIARLMGSRLQLDSTLDKGSRFWMDISLPFGNSGNFVVPDFAGMPVGIFCGRQKDIHMTILEKYLATLGCKPSCFGNMEDLDGHRELKVLLVDFSATGKAFLENLHHHVSLPVIVAACEQERGGLTSLGERFVSSLFKPVSYLKLMNALKKAVYGGAARERAEVKIPARYTGKVLVAEDNPVNQQFIQILMTNLGLEVDIAENGKVALNMAAMNKYDIIFMDIHMPVMDGITVTEHLLERERKLELPHVPIVALTANVTPEERRTYLEAGMEELLAKPIVTAALKELLNKYLSPGEADGEDSSKELRKLSESMGIDDYETLRLILGEFFCMVNNRIEEIKGLIEEENFKEIAHKAFNIKDIALSLRLQEVIKIMDNFLECCTLENKKTCHIQMENLMSEISKLRVSYGL